MLKTSSADCSICVVYFDLFYQSCFYSSLECTLWLMQEGHFLCFHPSRVSAWFAAIHRENTIRAVRWNGGRKCGMQIRMSILITSSKFILQSIPASEVDQLLNIHFSLYKLFFCELLGTCIGPSDGSAPCLVQHAHRCARKPAADRVRGGTFGELESFVSGSCGMLCALD